MQDSKAFPIPADCVLSPEAFELVSIWMCSKEPRVQFRGNAFEDPAVWGIVLADLASMVAQRYQESTGRSYDDILARVIAGFRAELKSKS